MIAAADPLFHFGHLATVMQQPRPVVLERYGKPTERITQTWFTWVCEAGCQPPEGVAWSHAELAAEMGYSHPERMAASV
ncbi:hypothetical protein GCM10010172_04480 [Paractinoplanes ferrugineus]|uniref:Uncharacterized protein n=1 Tax=Paractinoplanes ferrugineus TaxID=113564 RepID=A0A919MIG8_9ACTN|nr:hypothetical protein [Actinoplanes ferrugineus]GIE16833.1 hypothetical protein Afe05nite_86730 [Actinoplanes ferrugineus]